MTEDNPCAFPFQETTQGCAEPEYGMSLRDWFAGQALAGILASGAGEDDSQILRAIIAADAFCYADAMIKARKDKPHD